MFTRCRTVQAKDGRHDKSLEGRVVMLKKLAKPRLGFTNQNRKTDTVTSRENFSQV